MARTIHTNAFNAIREGQAHAPCGIAYVKGNGWQVYSLRDGVGADMTPEFICVAPGSLPVPLTDDGWQILRELFARKAGEA